MTESTARFGSSPAPCETTADPGDDLLWDLLQDPVGDPRLDAVPHSIRNPVSEIANALLAQGIEPTPRRVAALMRQLGVPDLEPDLLAGLLMELWWIRLDDLVPDDVGAMQAHLEVAPLRGHACCYYLLGLINGFLAGQPLAQHRHDPYRAPSGRNRHVD